ncbi:MAG TPA: hypothetical protein DDX89_08640, partial [Candidatus Omnitrophica bacterium]|nr:hypothetical protein [Candidatus Omnitrophota bacterium]
GTGSLRFLIQQGTNAVIAWGAQLESAVGTPGVYVRTTTDTQTASRGVISDGSPASTANVNSFATVAVGGQSNVLADSSTDTLTFAGSGNVTITTDAGTDTITISHSGAASGLETGTTSAAFTLDTDSSGTVDQDVFLYIEDDANATAHSLAWDDGLDAFIFDDDLKASSLTLTTDLAVTEGGTGAGTFTAGILLANGTNAFTTTAN